MSKEITITKDMISGIARDVSTYGFKEAQVTKGGISTEDLTEFFSLKENEKVFALGELVDINGVCGGYNLMYAFTSAYICGKRLLSLYENKNN